MEPSTAVPAFLFDPNKCTGCQACELACTIENELDGMSWRQVSTLNEAHVPGVPVVHLSLACNHCADPPCQKACPALAYSKDPVTGLVRLDGDKCIGCKYCSWACPYDAPRFDAPRGVMTKCTFCEHRQAAGLEPACVTQCPTGALAFGRLEEMPGTPHGFPLPTLEPGPSIRFKPWKGRDLPPPSAGAATVPSKITLRSEWPLALFTLIAAALVGWVTSAALGRTELRLVPFALAAALSFALSTLHLGRKLRAWRAILNVRRSWLSREIVLYSSFAGLGALACFVPGLAPAAAVVGFAALFAMDRVYDLARPPEARPLHSADVLLTGVLAASHGVVFTAVLAAKAVLYVVRKARRRGRGQDVRWGFGLLRLASLAVASAVPWVAIVGELVDRGELYTELDVPTPRGELSRRQGNGHILERAR